MMRQVMGIILAFGFTAALAVIPRTVTFTSFLAGSATAPINKPIFFAEIPGKPGYYAILEEHLGQVSVFHKVNNVWAKTIMDTVVFTPANSPVFTGTSSMGLLGLAFHPNFPVNHKYYLFYTPIITTANTSRTHIVERQTDTSLIKRNTAIASRLLLDVTGPYENHKGGTLAFGPKDGYLYMALGDGGPPSGQDPGNRAQNLDTLLGKFLRIDVDRTANGKQYAIPTDNPFVNMAAAPEVFALGLRNPFKWSFDPFTGNIWLGHVGQNAWESATLVPKGANLGWRILEGSHCNPLYGTTCSTAGYHLPFFTYPNTPTTVDSTGNCIIGGYVYRGNLASPFYGLYFFGDNQLSRIWVARTDGVTTQERVLEGVLPNGSGALTSFGTDLSGNLYAVHRGTNSATANNGTIYLLGGPDLQTVSISARRIAKGFAPPSARELAGMDLRSLQGRRVSGHSAKSGVYVMQRPGENNPALVPVLK